ncbi:MAG: gliding motility protein GldN [Bacteroidales bacterium]|nr:gliding motility protein GldN [Bacteroidales bacterium]
MKSLRLIIAVLLIGLTVDASAQVSRTSGGDRNTGVSRRSGNDRGNKGKKEPNSLITDRQQSFYEVREPSDADLQWMKVIYRSIDLTVGKNPALYYPEEPNADGENLFFIIMRLLANDQISAYEYLDGREMFTDEFKIKVDEMLDRFHILYTEAKGSSPKHPIYQIEPADIPSNEVLSYFVIEKWEFDTRSNQMKARVEALCPVLHRMDEWGGEAVRYPMFWVKLNDIRPYMAQQYVFTDDDNNLARYSIDDFFKLNMYTGEIYKTKNLRNLSLRQMYPEDEAYKHAQDSIEQRLRSFNQDLWVPPLEVLQARAEAEEKARAEAEGETVEGEEGAEQVDGEAAAESSEEKVTRTTKRGSKSKTTKKETKSKTKKTKIKERKPKTSTQTVNTGIRSVRNRKK